MGKDVLRFVPIKFLSTVRLKSIYKDLLAKHSKGEIVLEQSLQEFINFKEFAYGHGYNEDTIIKTNDGSNNYTKQTIIFVDE